MWHFISDQISQCTGKDFICDDIRDVEGGDTHRAYKISDGKRRFFVKTNGRHHLPHFEAEAEGLRHLSETQLFTVPDVVCTGTVSDHSFIVLEHILMQPGDAADWYALGQRLAELHLQETQAMYGWQEDNYIGHTLQPNAWHKKWCQFFAEQRIGYLLQVLDEKGEALADVENVVTAVKALLQGHTPSSSMLHGDLWQGNVGFQRGAPVLFDPAMYFGDREADIAMTELFSKFPQAFYNGYNSVWPLDDDYQYRKSVYQLYHILNHALLFGGHYVDSARAMLKNLDH